MSSTCVAEVEYDEPSEEMTITFVEDGTTYTYISVPWYTYDALLSAPSAGQYFNYNIRNEYGFR